MMCILSFKSSPYLKFYMRGLRFIKFRVIFLQKKKVLKSHKKSKFLFNIIEIIMIKKQSELKYL